MNLVNLIAQRIKRGDRPRRKLSAGSANLQFTWLQFAQGINQQDSNGNPISADCTGSVAVSNVTAADVEGVNESITVSWDAYYDQLIIDHFEVYDGATLLGNANPADTSLVVNGVSGLMSIFVRAIFNNGCPDADTAPIAFTPNPYNGALVYTRQGLGVTTVVNPVGAYNLTFGANKVTEIHCHNCSSITSITCTGNALLTSVDINNCETLTNLDFTNAGNMVTFSLVSPDPALNINLNGCAALSELDFTGVTSIGQLQLGYMTSLTSFLIPDLVTCGGLSLYNSGLSSFSAPVLTTSTTWFYIYDNAEIVSISAPELTYAADFGLVFRNNSVLTSVDLPLLDTTAYVDGNSNPNLATLSLPSLANVAGPVSITSCDLLETISLPSLTTCSVFECYSCISLTSLDVSAMSNCPYFDCSTCELLTTVDLPSMGPIEIMYGVDTISLSTVSFGSGIISNFGEVVFGNSNLSEATVDFILASGIAGSMTLGYIDLSGGSSSTPSATGLADKATLITNGVTVLTN